MTTLSDLLKAQSKDEVLDSLVALFRSAGFPTASWLPGTVLRHMAEFQAYFLATVSEDVAAIAAGGFLDTAEGGWLDLLVASVFADARKVALFTEGEVLLTDTGAVGPVTINPDAYWFQNSDGSKRYRNANTAPLTLPNAGTLVVPVRAEIAGAAYNVGSLTIITINPSIPGVNVTNPANVTRGTWVTVQGTDAEPDASLRQRMRDKWAVLGSGSNDSAYRYWVKSVSSEVTRVRVVGYQRTGHVDVTVAGSSGPISQAAYDLVKANVEAKRPVGILATVYNATAANVPVVATIYLAPGAVWATVTATVQTAIDTYARSVDIGGIIYWSRIVAAIQDVSGVRSVTLTSPAADVTLGGSQVWTPSYTLTMGS